MQFYELIVTGLRPFVTRERLEYQIQNHELPPTSLQRASLRRYIK